MNWYMVTIVGKDRPGIVAAVSGALFEAGCHLGEASMSRLGDSFTIMVMVRTDSTAGTLEDVLRVTAADMDLRLHVDALDTGLHRHVQPDLRVTVFGADRAGIVAQVTRRLADAGFHICHLETDVGGSESKPFYVMNMEGRSTAGREAVETAMQQLNEDNIDVSVSEVDTMIG